MPKILIVNDIVDWDNWGANALSFALRRILATSIDDCEIRTLGTKWTIRRFRRVRKLGHIYVEPNRFWGPFSRPHLDIIPAVADHYEPVAREWLEGRGGKTAEDFLAAADGVDAVVFNAEGSTYRNNLSAVRSLFALWFAKKHLGLPSFFLNGSVTLTPVDPLLPAMVRRTFSAIDGIAVREPFSQRNVKKWTGIDVEVVPDSVFHLCNDARSEPSNKLTRVLAQLEGRPFFCFSGSMLLSATPGFPRWGVRNWGPYRLLTELKKVVPNVVLMYKDGMERGIMSALADAVDGVLTGPEFEFDDLNALLSRAAFLVSGRYHHLIFAAIAGCPGICLRTSSHKVEGLCELLEGHFGETYDPTDLRRETPAIAQRAREIVAWDPSRRTEIRDHATALGQRSLRLGGLVNEGLLK